MEQNLTDDGPIDFAYIQQVMAENPEDWYSPEEAEARFNAVLRKMLDDSDSDTAPRRPEGAEAEGR